MLNKTDTNPELFTKNEFIVHAPESGYYYPFSAEQTDYSQVPNDYWPDSLPEAYRRQDGIYIRPGFDLKQDIASQTAPIVEIGGPTNRGYQFLSGAILPNRPLMTDIVGSEMDERGFDSLVAVDKLVLDALMDVRHFPIADESAGIILASCLPKVDQHTVRQRNDDSHTRTMGEIVDNYTTASSYIDHGAIDALRETTDSPRIAAILQAARTIKPGGLFITKGMNEHDAAIAEAAGLNIMMHTPNRRHSSLPSQFDIIDEAVFKKPAAGY